MSTVETSIRLEQRFNLLREIIANYRIRLKIMEEQVVQLFASNQLSAISESIREKQRIERRLQKLEQFVAHWEPLADMSIDH
jgi:hypothetical protein